MRQSALTSDDKFAPKKTSVTDLIPEADSITIDEMPRIVDLQIKGTAAGEKLVSGSTSDGIEGRGGDDVLLGRRGADILDGGNGSDVLDGGGGNDRLNAGSGNDTLRGGIGNDHLVGGNGKDLLQGQGGDDILEGGQGTGDQLTGGEGRDAFILQINAGSDVITDFQAGVDRLGLPTGLTFAELTVSLCSCGTKTLISVDGSLIATLLNTQPNQISATDFAPVIRAL